MKPPPRLTPAGPLLMLAVSIALVMGVSSSEARECRDIFGRRKLSLIESNVAIVLSMTRETALKEWETFLPEVARETLEPREIALAKQQFERAFSPDGSMSIADTLGLESEPRIMRAIISGHSTITRIRMTVSEDARRKMAKELVRRFWNGYKHFRVR